MLCKRTPEVLTVDDATPSRLLAINDLMLGDKVEQWFSFGAIHRTAFKTIANDRAPVHEDDRFAYDKGFSGPIIQGLCVATRFSRLIGMYLPGEGAILESLNVKYLRPTYEGQALLFCAEVTRLLSPMKVVRLALSARSDTAVHVSGEAQCLVR